MEGTTHHLLRVFGIENGRATGARQPERQRFSSVRFFFCSTLCRARVTPRISAPFLSLSPPFSKKMDGLLAYLAPPAAQDDPARTAAGVMASSLVGAAREAARRG
jgi:hypothetical protein